MSRQKWKYIFPYGEDAFLIHLWWNSRRKDVLHMAEYSFHNKIKDFSLTAKGANQKVAVFLVDHLQDAAFMTVEEVAQRTGVSPGTVSRAAKAMGFAGFPDIQEQIRQIVRSSIAPVARMEKIDRDRFDVRASLQFDIENLQSLSTHLSSESVQKAVSLLSKTETIRVMATRSSYSVAYFLALALSQIRENVFLMDVKTGQLFDESRRLRAGDLFVAVALPRYSQDTIFMTEEARKAGCHILAVTDSLFSPLSALADITLPVPYESLSFFNSYVASFALANILIAQTAVCLKKKSTESLEQLNRLHEEHAVFYT